MHTRFKQRRYEVLVARSLDLADAAQLMVDELIRLARDHQSLPLAHTIQAYRAAIDDVQRGARLGVDLPPLLYRLEAVGRDVATVLNSVKQALIREAEAVPPDPAPNLAARKF